MAEWWSSLPADTLRSINTWGQVFGILCTAGVVLSGVFVFLSSGRLGELAAEGEKALRTQVQRTEEDLRRAEEERRPRQLTDAQIQSLVATLQAVPVGRIDVESIVGDMEGDTYGNRFEQAFGQAGWNVTRARATGNHGIQPGMRLIVPVTPNGQGVAAAFARAGLDFTLEQAPIDYVWLRVGVKSVTSATGQD